MADQKLNIVLRAFDKTRAGFAGVRRGLDGVKKSVFSVKGALVGLGSGAALKAMASNIDELAKQSARLGITVNQLQTLQFAASQSGTGAAELSKGFEKFNKSISEASTGLGTSVKAFDALGVTLTNNDGSLKTTDELLNEVADGFTNIENPADRVRFAMDLFGRSGAGMVNMLQEGSEELKKTREEYNKLTFALSGEDAKKVEEANDLFDKLKRTLGSIAQQITVAVLPAMASLGKALLQNVLTKVANTIQGLSLLKVAFAEFFNATLAQLPGFSEMSEEAFGEATVARLREVASAYNEVTVNVEEIGVKAKGAGEEITRLQTPLEQAVGKLKDFSDSSKELKANLAEAALNGLGHLEDGIMSIIDGTKSAKDAFKDMARSIVNDLLKIAIQKSITGPLAGALGGFVGGGKAIGGAVQAGGSYLVGERGPEILTMGTRGGHIIPNNQVSSGGGVVINQSINISTGVAQTVRTEIAQLMPQITQASKAAVIDAQRRGSM
jgi:uncharacterized phage infection (PIP) family protein YhgE